jgi:hypothetical protein
VEIFKDFFYFSILTLRDHDINLNLHHVRKLSCKSKLFWSGSSSIDPSLSLHFCDYLHCEEDLALYLNKLEFPSPKNDLYQVWLKLACWFWKRCSKNFSLFLLFYNYLPLEKDVPLDLNEFEPTPQRMICANSR